MSSTFSLFFIFFRKARHLQVQLLLITASRVDYYSVSYYEAEKEEKEENEA